VHLLGATSVLELGTHKGFTTIHLARALADNPRARLVTVDSKDQRSDSLRTLDGSHLFVQGHDLEVVPTLKGEFDLVYIDTTHRYEHTVAEIDMLSRHSPRAVLVLHDVLSCPEVRRAIDQFGERYDCLVLPTPPHPTLGWINGLALLQPKRAREANG
jgi:predicted O-methyltransferase YrrM